MRPHESPTPHIEKIIIVPHAFVFCQQRHQTAQAPNRASHLAVPQHSLVLVTLCEETPKHGELLAGGA